MSRATYGRRTCWICHARGIKRDVSCAGVGFVSHMRAHVRRGEAVERVDGKFPDVRCSFEAVKKQP